MCSDSRTRLRAENIERLVFLKANVAYNSSDYCMPQGLYLIISIF